MNEIKRGEIYYADLTPAVGSEQSGIRPVLILQNNTGNVYSPTTIVAAITSRKTKKPLPTHIRVQIGEAKIDSVILLEQIRTVDKRRLGEYVDRLEPAMMSRVNTAIDISLGMSN